MKINSIESVAETLGKSTRRVQQLVKEFNIPVVKGISEADLKRLRNRKTQPGPRPRVKK